MSVVYESASFKYKRAQVFCFCFFLGGGVSGVANGAFHCDFGHCTPIKPKYTRVLQVGFSPIIALCVSLPVFDLWGILPFPMRG